VGKEWKNNIITINNVKIKTLHLVRRGLYQALVGILSPSMVTSPIRNKVRVR
jgi:hypothetical protein